MITVRLKPGRARPVLNGHPWIFSGAIAGIDGNPEPGDACRVLTAEGGAAGFGYCNPRSAITVRMLGGQEPAAELIIARIRAAAARRLELHDAGTDVCRLVNSEGDLLPGLVVDRYGSGLCVQFLTAGMERWRQAVLAALEVLPGLPPPAFIFDRSDARQRQLEGLPPAGGLLAGAAPVGLTVREHGITYAVDPGAGQKTGFFIDQRENRLLLRRYASGRRTLDCCCYSGGFGLNALAAGAPQATFLDDVEDALTLAGRNLALNAGQDRAELVRADAFQWLRRPPAGFGCIVLDPPKFARGRKQAEAAARGYKELNRLAMLALEPDGILFTFSCSQAVDVRLFRQIVFAAAADSGRRFQVLHVLTQAPDHAVDITHPEGEYLTGLVLRHL